MTLITAPKEILAKMEGNVWIVPLTIRVRAGKSGVSRSFLSNLRLRITCGSGVHNIYPSLPACLSYVSLFDLPPY